MINTKEKAGKDFMFNNKGTKLLVYILMFSLIISYNLTKIFVNSCIGNHAFDFKVYSKRIGTK